MSSRLEKSLAHRFAVMLAPECAEVLAAFREKRDGWVRLPQRLEQSRQNIGLGDAYVLTYGGEALIMSCLMRWVFPENTAESIKELDEEFRQASSDSIIEWAEEAADGLEIGFDALFNMTDSEREGLRRQFDTLPEGEKISELYKAQNLLAFVYAYFYNILSLMVHGQKLTTLVPLALQGDKEAFCKAAQIDRNLLTGHPYFRDTFARLNTGDDTDFLDALLYRIGNPSLRGRIRYPALFSLFAVLDSFGLLDEFTAPEILDMCDEAKLDRFQNRIDDESNLNKRRAEYRRYQKLPK